MSEFVQKLVMWFVGILMASFILYALQYNVIPRGYIGLAAIVTILVIAFCKIVYRAGHEFAKPQRSSRRC